MPLVSKSFSDIITFSRGTNATYFDSAGVLKYAPNNLLLQSEDFSTTWTVTGATVSANATTAPSGATTADKLQEDASTGSHLVTQNITFTATSYTASLFAKKAERDWVRVLFFDGTNTFSAFFNLDTGVVGTVTGSGATAAIQNSGNGWYRCSVTATVLAGSGSFAPRVALADNNSSYTGSAGSGIYIWGAQLEEGAFPTSYIPTTTIALTRAADVASVNTLSPWFNATESTIYAEVIPVSATPPTQQAILSLDDGTTSNVLYFARIQTGSSANRFRVNSRTGGSIDVDKNITSPTIQAGLVSKVVAAIKLNDFAFTIGGAAVGTDTSALVSPVNRLVIGNYPFSSGIWNGHIRRITYYPRRLSNAELVAITS